MKLEEKIKICETILSTGEYYTKKANRKEPIMFIRYLKEQGYDEDGAFKIWYPIEHQAYGGDEETKRYIFSKLWQMAIKGEWGDDPYIGFIYQDELDDINKTDMPRWAKEMMVCLVIYSRMRKEKNKFKYDIIMYNKFIKYTSYPKGHRTSEDTARIAPLLKEYGFIQTKEYTYYDKSTGETDVDMCYVVNVKHNKNCTDIAFGIDKISGLKIIQGNKNIITTFKKCDKCGKEFEYTLSTRKNICDDCWKEQELQRVKVIPDNRERHDNTDKRNTHNNYTKQSVIIKTCSCCGNEFQSNTQSKTTLCHTCYTIKRKQDINKNASRYYYKT